MRTAVPLIVVLALCCLPGRSAAQSCPCYGPNTCNGNCAGSECCRFGCTDYATDVYNCGTCGKSCGPSSTCVGGVCNCVNGTTRPCYTGPLGTQGVGPCHGGTQTCNANAWSTCTGEVVPVAEDCNGADDDCDGRTDNVPGMASPLSSSCYTGPAGTESNSPCHGGQHVCQGGAWSACLGEVVPPPNPRCDTNEACTGGLLVCADAGTPDVGTADVGQPDVGTPDAGTPDVGTAVGQPDVGTPDTGCGSVGPCYSGPAETADRGVCKSGTWACTATGSTCTGQVLPGAPRCDGLDHDCNGVVDSACPVGEVCTNGQCVPATCGGELGLPCPTGYSCTAAQCVADTCSSGTPCPAGTVCVLGACHPPCDGACKAGESCYNDKCVPDDCTAFGCSAGLFCVGSVCQPDPCSGKTCAAGQMCKGGTCTNTCATITCPSGLTCVADGTCQPDPCAAVDCAAPKVCVAGACSDDPCRAVTCPPAQVCRGGKCVANACLGVACPANTACRDGQCYPVTGVDAGAPLGDAGSGGADASTPGVQTGCGCASTEAASPLLLLGLGALVGWARRASTKRKR